MAKGNLFLGFARGSVGDVTLYRSEGEQISRARNRHPFNPRSARQSIQRAVNSSVSRIYAAGQVLFNHSFQGIAPGKNCQRKFIQMNNRILRQMVLDDLANNTDNARLGVPGVSVAVPCDGIMVSNGNYPIVFFSWDATTKSFHCPTPGSEDLSVAQFAEKFGLVAGDIFTFGALSLDNSGAAIPAWEDVSGLVDHKVWPSKFQFQQLLVKDVSGVTRECSGSEPFSTFFENYKQEGEVSLLDCILGDSIALDTMTNNFSDDGCIFLIRSKYGEDLRSTSFLMPANAGDYGIKSQLVIPAWTNPAALQDPDLILDGSEFVGE